MPTELDQDAMFDPNRRLCPDGNCVGVIDRNGRCSICATAAPEWHEGGDPGQESIFHANPETPAEAQPAVDEADQGDKGDFDPGRSLCSDGSCIGVIGSDNCCTVCGKPALT
jgi:hypothetical protein